MKFSLRFNLFLLLLAGITAVGRKRRSTRGIELSSEDLELYTLNHDSIDEYDFTAPIYIEPDLLVSKRSVDSEPVTSQEREVKFNAFGRVYHVRLEPNTWLVRQGLVAEYVAADGSVTEEPITSWDCHYFAHLISHVGESVGALSTCHGLRGLISHDDTDVYIAPLKDHHALRYRREIQDELDGEHAHIVYKRTASQSGGQQTSDTMSSASSSFSYEHDYDGHDDHLSDGDVEDELSYYSDDRPSDNDNGNDTYDNSTFCETAYAVPENTDTEEEPSEQSSSWDEGYEEWGNTSHPGPIFADRMRAGQEDGEHKQEGGQRYIELLLLVDDTMKKFHKEDIMNYSLTLMNIVARRFADPSMKSEVRLALTKIVVAETNMLKMLGLDGKNYTLHIQADGYILVRHFCSWQRRFNPRSDKDPLHYDGAVLLTRRDLYKMAGNRKMTGLMGRAPIGTICRGHDSCNINEEDGLEASFTVTHELGHNLNLLHDPDYGCANGRNIMSSMKVIGPSAAKWSRCSAEKFAKFLETWSSFCLRDEPSYDHPDVQMLRLDQLAGARYTRLEQCQLAWGTVVQALCNVDRVHTTCGKIACRRWGHCVYAGVMEGTSCGEDQWCYEGHCRSSIGGIPQPVNGGWSEWTGNYTECSRTCGTGVKYRRRMCNNPAPRFGGLACEGAMFIMETCNENPCPGINSSDDYRHRECALTNSRKYKWSYHKWTAVLDGDLYGDRVCDLKCKSNKRQIAIRPPNRVSTGTRCWDDQEPDELRRIRRCVIGYCKEFGCDGVYGSGKMLDGCHKCEGTGRTCIQKKGSVRERIPVGTYAHWKWLTIPIGSTTINITNTSRRYYALAMKLGDKFVFKTGSRQRTDTQRWTVGKTHILFRTDDRVWEQLWILSGPTTQQIEIHVLKDRITQRSWWDIRNNPVLFYEWYEPISDPVSYYWETTPITECSASCGGGNQTVTITCFEDINGERMNVSDRFCNETKPSIYPECNTQLCPGPHWRIGEWGSCSVTCDEGIETQVVDCIEGGTMDILPTNDCIVEKGYQPDNTRPCHQLPCPTQGPTSPRPTEIMEIETSVSTSTMPSTGNMTTLDYVTMDLTTSRSSESEGSEPPPVLSIPRDSACAKKCNNLNLLFCLIISILMASNKFNM